MIWNNPQLVSNYQDIAEAQTLFGVAESVFEDKFGKEMPELYNKFEYPVFYDVNL